LNGELLVKYLAGSMSLPEFHGREMFIGITCLVVVFSLLIQATTLGPQIRRLNVSGAHAKDAPSRRMHVAAKE
jgi:monovalent cation:H+ antiporter, CPA1 family